MGETTDKANISRALKMEVSKTCFGNVLVCFGFYKGVFISTSGTTNAEWGKDERSRGAKNGRTRKWVKKKKTTCRNFKMDNASSSESGLPQLNVPKRQRRRRGKGIGRGSRRNRAAQNLGGAPAKTDTHIPSTDTYHDTR